MSMPCPRCDGSVLSTRFGDVSIELCESCSGVLVELRNLVPLLTEMSKEIADAIDPDGQVEPIVDVSGSVSCPLCTQKMTNFGYMGTRLVYIDRCSSCSVLWVDPDELGTMSHLFVRTSKRTAETKQMYEEYAESLSKRVSAALRGRAMGNIAFTFMAQ